VGRTARIFVGAGEKAVKRGVHAGLIAADLARIIGGGGGGKPYFGQGGGTMIEKVDEVVKAAEEALLRQVRR
jgi:alanyl-tRNA synthetase